MTKLDTSSLCELGVQSQYLDGEGYLVDDSLARPVATGKKLQVTNIIETSVPVNMVDRLFGEQFSPEMLGHDVTVFQDSVPFAGDHRGHRNPNVTVPLDMFFVVPAFKAGECTRADRFVAAFRTAVLLLSVDAPARFAAFIQGVSALLASKCVAVFSIFSPPQRRAGDRAVQRVAVKFLTVRNQVPLAHGESFTALFAGKWNQHLAGGRKFFLESVFAPAFQTAVLATLFGFVGVAVERLVAILTDHFERHDSTPLFNKGSVVGALGVVK